ncbi:ABC transporter permease [Caulobacter sp. 17J80-11]|uniref:ABC transporter permease n=1 Tax=Caulobacter sp. 17J80-11 TaxID=2763502 RepID=UPI001CA3E0EF|nr:ABC transporter permease [Caulobacter sp. 17J80-11]
MLLIARREYFAYARTVGFWLSMLALPALMLLGGMMPAMIKNASPTRTVAIVDFAGGQQAALTAALDARYVTAQAKAMREAAVSEAGEPGADAVREAVDRDGLEAGLAALKRVAPRAGAAYAPPKRDLRVVAAPPEVASAPTLAAAEKALRPHLTGGELSAVVLLERRDGELKARLWSERVSDEAVETAVRDALRDVIRRDRLIAAGLDPATATSLAELKPKLDVFSPKSAGGGEVSLRDRLPGVVGFVLGMLLWSSVISGASILMNSVMEEKSNRVLEVLMSSASTTEILGGKVLGVAMITATVLGVWFGLGAYALRMLLPGLADDLGSVLLDGGLIFYLALYLVGGYLMYAMVFAAIGAFCETPRDAQTLLGPVMIVLSVPIIVMQMAVRTPDLPLIKTMSMVPFFAPFLMSARAPSNPPLIEVVIALAGMAAVGALMVWLGGKAFRAGALSSGKFDWRGVFALMTGRG